MQSLTENEVYVWQIEWKNVPAAIISNLQQILSQDEHAQMEKYKIHADRMRFCIGRAIARFLSGHYLNMATDTMRLAINDFGKPYWQQQKLLFNISHSGSWVVVAFALGREIGIDVEVISNGPKFDFKNIAKHSFHPDEIAYSSSKEKFYDIWSRKEAVIKALGIGLHGDLQKLSVLPIADFGKWSTINCKDWCGVDYVSTAKFSVDDGHVGAIAVIGNKIPEIKFFGIMDLSSIV